MDYSIPTINSEFNNPEFVVIAGTVQDSLSTSLS